MRVGKAEIQQQEDNQNEADASENIEAFVDSLGVSELYTIGVGAGYCYHAGFNCVYGMYNNYLTGQLSTVDEDGKTSAVPTQLKGWSVGMSSTFEVGLGVEVTAGLEYSLLEHITTVNDPQQINALSLVVGLGFIEPSRYNNMRKIKMVIPPGATRS